MLIESQVRLDGLYSYKDVFGIADALSAGKAKLDEYFDMAKGNGLIVLASILHPGIRLSYFQDVTKWGESGPTMARRGREILGYLYEDYKPTLSVTSSVPQPTKPEISGSSSENWFNNLLTAPCGGPSTTSCGPEELRDYFDGRYQYNGGNILAWWKENEVHFPVLSQIAQDFLAILATSVSVERLFSCCKLVMSDYCNMSVETARRIITCQQWLEAGLGIDLPDFISSNNN
ncbi:hAT family C-terminal dimerization region, partial [Rhizoctonia solani]